MSVAIFSLASSLHAEAMKPVSEEPFIIEVQKAYGEEFLFPGDEFSTYGTNDLDLIFVRTGGTEGLFRKLGIKGDVKILTSGESNSLAASMEILSYLHQHGQKGEIIHGSPEAIALRLRNISSCEAPSSPFVHPMEPVDLGGGRLGVIGHPSDWLISSDVDYAKAKRLFNVELVDIPMDELIAEIRKHDVDLRSFEGSEAIHDSLCTLVKKYDLSGLTIRCFDLLDTVHNTGCLALARLNADGIPSSCEGDVPSLLTMVWMQKKRGCPGFQCNLSRIEGDELLFAHCTVPFSMVKEYHYTTHFESGIGTAIKGELPLSDVEIVKIAPDLEHFVCIPGHIVRNTSKPNLCRTQIVVNAPGAAGYFLNEPLANHHIVSILN